ncbi:hypothetical protein KW419_11335 [Vibrio fluvialis]|uniref:hypothetical protein n=1 Tax=Vibrio TaxID=662 RepID=UPI0005F1A9FF|nr:hypothetical protein [Vibrio vulnificus]EKO3995417.1 hypothetical protein [Vibrio fluvialis]ELO1812195.1 hypothetical protein [Vibrio fluvialis]ELV8554255.1 hypothetical protein [Vibrio fluvialis]ELV8596818.1 hypothetical protein [Vibrio fluvialis]MBY7858835.1 hypothetical protein [Vibrio fluvialis]
MKEPSLTDIKLRSEIPVDAKFIGWIIYNPLQDDFLWKFRENARALFKQWIIYPDMALRFKKYKQAIKMRDDLDLRGIATIVAAFDCGPEIRIGN